ncbi:type III pantothenate kinase [Adhaeribacter rhizoryzae]|uniref:Type III pantothenate kinase n=1 Tax=Adhaeribacter rhizoryzae TaxID=2607907 RepID=A0A5M6DFU5_9BACT|nr:type III pantothenate kinase [Adhaeribacter rhizoryzae]KAA5546401.1 type III pantothenate kinase [Adhaeribacter rhizoryzae]
MQNLAIDMGNSAIKYAFFAGSALERTSQVSTPDELLQQPEIAAIDNIILSSVRTGGAELAERLAYTGTFISLDYTTPVPLQNHYQTPQTLGMDRLAAAVGANYLFPDCDCLVIDAGTCITCDLVDKEKNFRGGSISPGLQMKFRAMHTFTQKLPLVEQTNLPVPLAGRTTVEAMQSGVLNGTVAELNGFISAYAEICDQLVVVLCGGDAAFFETSLKAPIFAVPELVLIGLNRILNYNV